MAHSLGTPTIAYSATEMRALGLDAGPGICASHRFNSEIRNSRRRIDCNSARIARRCSSVHDSISMKSPASMRELNSRSGLPNSSGEWVSATAFGLDGETDPPARESRCRREVGCRRASSRARRIHGGSDGGPFSGSLSKARPVGEARW